MVGEEVSSVAVVIPARYASTRFPGKPLAQLGGKSMLKRVYENVEAATAGLSAVTIIVATEDQRIVDHCQSLGMNCVLTSDNCHTGTDRVWEAVKDMNPRPDFILNMQGDAPFTPPGFIRAMIDELNASPALQMVTPVMQLSWDALDTLRDNKKTTPFSGTTAILDRDRYAVWFSKNIIPAIRPEKKLREASTRSPVFQHIGLYGYSFAALEKFVTLLPSPYEELEGLEQLRALENGITIRAVIVENDSALSLSGIDSPEDLERAEKLLSA